MFNKAWNVHDLLSTDIKEKGAVQECQLLSQTSPPFQQTLQPLIKLIN